MKSVAASLLGAIVAFAGCAKSENVQTSDVLTLVQCPDGGECQLVADGVSLITVEACIPAAVTPLASGLTVTLLASGGTWQNPPDKTKPTVYTTSLSANRCTRPNLIAPSNVLVVHIDAQLAGYTSSVDLDLAPATLQTIELTAQPAFLAPHQTNQIAVHAVARSAGLGNATAGTTMTFATSVAPPNGYVILSPETAIIDQNFTAQTTAVVAATTTSVTITATAVGPTQEGAPPPSSITNHITIRTLPVDGGAD